MSRVGIARQRISAGQDAIAVLIRDLRVVARLEVGDLDAIGAAADARIGNVAEQAEGTDAGIPGVADQQRAGRRPFLLEVAIIALGVDADMEALVVEGLARVEVDRAGKAAFDRGCGDVLVDLD